MSVFGAIEGTTVGL